LYKKKVLKTAKKHQKMQSFCDDEFIYRPVLVAPVRKISADNNRNFSCSEKKNIYIVKWRELDLLILSGITRNTFKVDDGM